MNLNRKWAFLSVLALGTTVGVAAAGCGDDSTSATPVDSGAKDTGANTTDGSPNTTDGSTPTDSGTPSDYTQLGGHDGIAAAVKKVVEGTGATPNDGELGDPQLASYFAIRTGGPGGAPSAAVIEDCFTQFVCEQAGGPEVYAGYMSMATGAPAGGFACRSMAEAHNGLHITDIAFAKFIGIAATNLATQMVPTAILMDLAPKLEGTSGDIVDPLRSAADGGTEAGNSLYGAECANIAEGDGGNPDAGCNPYK